MGGRVVWDGAQDITFEIMPVATGPL
jgi:hypothetical protein